MADKLQQIATKRRGDVRKLAAATPQDAVAAAAAAVSSPPLNLAEVLEGGASIVAAEFKRASPSKGAINADVPLAEQVAAYAAAGAGMVSVLTEPDFFGGSLEDLREARATVGDGAGRPLILRKDFVVDEYQVHEARAAGADTLLLIVAILDPAQLRALLETARGYGMEPLVEVANVAEVATALDTGARVIGVNNRDLRTFVVDLGTTAAVVAAARAAVDASSSHPPISILSLSGIRDGGDVAGIAAACAGEGSGVQLAGVLVGEALMKAAHPGALVAELRAALAGGAAPAAPPPSGFVKVCGVTCVEDALVAARAGAGAVGVIRVPGSKRTPSGEEAAAIVAALRAFREQDPAPELAAGLAAAQAAAAEAAGTPAASRAQLLAATTPTAAVPWFQAFWSTGLLPALRRAAPLAVGVYQNASAEEVLADATAAGFDLVQLHGDEDASLPLALAPLPVIRVLHAPPSGSGGDAVQAAAAMSSSLRAGGAAVLLLDARVPGTAGGGSGAALDVALPAALPAALPFVLAGGLTAESVAGAVSAAHAWGADVSSGVEAAGAPPRKDAAAVAAYVQAAKGACSQGLPAAAAGAAAAGAGSPTS